MTRQQLNKLLAEAYNLHVGPHRGNELTADQAAKLPRGDKAALCRLLEVKGGSSQFTAVDAAHAFALVTM